MMERAPGPWRLQMWYSRCHRWYGIPWVTIRLNRPGPTKPRRMRVGPFRFVLAPSVGSIRRKRG